MQFFRRLRLRRCFTSRRRPNAEARPSLSVREFECRITPSTLTSTSLIAPYGMTCTGNLLRDSSGNLYCTASAGGTAGEGTVFELPAGSSTLTALATFTGANGANPHSSLVMDSSGNLYGTTSNGGANNDGTVFELATSSNSITTLASFSGTNGANPQAGLLMDGNGNLYGTTANGGANHDGTIFKVAAGSGSITTLASFNGTNGTNPLGVLIADSAGNLYGTTANGGKSGDGTVFEVTAGSNTITTLASFTGTNGANPQAGLTMDGSGNLYGTAERGGAYNDGTVFKVAHGSSVITALASCIPGTTGYLPLGGLVMDGSGNLYGTTLDGPNAIGQGSIFELAAGSNTITTLAKLGGTTGVQSAAGLVMDASGNLYGTTLGQGSSPGSVFQLAPASRTLTVLARLDYPNGDYPLLGGVVLDSSGNLYGTAANGGASNAGTVFELAAGSGVLTTLASFNGTNGRQPASGLIMDSSGNMYGATRYGGANDDGTLFEMTAGSGTITTLATFNGSNGANPLGGLVMDSQGNLYGTTTAGGVSNYGTVFEIVPGSGTMATLASFPGGNEAGPQGSLTVDAQGNLYGTTQGVSSGLGAVFELAAGSHTITTLATFTVTKTKHGSTNNGSYPQGGLVRDSSGNLYGATASGGASGDGTIFKVVAGSGKITTLVSFSGSNGNFPQGGLIADSSGNLYGTTTNGGTSNDGAVFELPAESQPVTVLASFNGSAGQDPACNLVMDNSGNLYGTTTKGGSCGLGSVFEITLGNAPLTASAGRPLSPAGSPALALTTPAFAAAMPSYQAGCQAIGGFLADWSTDDPTGFTSAPGDPIVAGLSRQIIDPSLRRPTSVFLDLSPGMIDQLFAEIGPGFRPDPFGGGGRPW